MPAHTRPIQSPNNAGWRRWITAIAITAWLLSFHRIAGR